MSETGAILEAIAKSDPDVAELYLRDMAHQIGSEQMSAIKREMVETYPHLLAQASAVLRRNLGRDYVSKAMSGQRPFFDPELMEAYRRIHDVLVSKAVLTEDSFVVRGNTLEVLRDDKGRFARRGIPIEESREAAGAAVVGRFSHPGERGRQLREQTKREGQERRRWIAPAESASAVFAPPPAGDDPEARLELLDESAGGGTAREKAHRYGLHSQAELNNAVDMFERYGVLDKPGANRERQAGSMRVRVEAQNYGNPSQRRVFDAVYDSRDHTFRMPKDARTGWGITDIEVDSSDPQVAANMRQIPAGAGGEREQLFQHEFGGVAPTAAGITEMQQRQGLGSEKSRTAGVLNAIGGGLKTVGLKTAGNRLQGVASRIDAVNESEARATLAQTAYRFRGVEATRVSPTIIAAAEGQLPEGDGFTTSREKYYNETLPSGSEIGDAIEMGQKRDYTTMALWRRHAARTSNAGMGRSAGTANVNYNKLAQDISRGIGRGMPSEGVLMDRKGRVVSQSMGVTHDGYLPFNAEALTKLSGGQYVRTRQLGGFSGEDVRTLLVGNGRAGQVVSNSGVFELEMDPSLRGTRRYNDVALQMVDTYDRILDEVAEGGHYAVPLPAAQEKAARSEAASLTRNRPGDYDSVLATSRHKQYNQLAALDEKEMNFVRSQVESGAREEYAEKFGARDRRGRPIGVMGAEMTPRERDYVETKVAEAVRERQDEKSRMLSLNAEGYALALKTLQQHYPYMIRTARYRSWEDFNEESPQTPLTERQRQQQTVRGRDAWYSPPGMLRPAARGRAAADVGGVRGEDYRTARGIVAGGPRTRTDEMRRIIPGAGAGGGLTTQTSGGMTQASQSLFDQRVDNGATAVQRRIRSIPNLQHQGEENAVINDAWVSRAQDNKTKARRALALFAQDPDTAARMLGDEDGRAVAEALADPMVAEQIVNDPDYPSSIPKERMQAVMDSVVAVAAVKSQRNATRIEPEAGLAGVPDGDGPVMLNDAGRSPTEISRMIQSNPEYARALRSFEAAAIDRGVSPIHPDKPVKDLNKVLNTYNGALNEGTAGDQVRSDLASSGTDTERIEILRSNQLISDDEANSAVGMLANGGNNVLGDGGDQAVSDIRRQYRLGHGLWLQQKVGSLAADPESRHSPLAEGPALQAPGRPQSGREYLWENVRRMS